MPIEVIQTPKVSAPVPLLLADSKRYLFIPGHTGNGPDGELVTPGADLVEQTREVYRNLAKSLAEVGADFSHLVKLSAYVVGFDPNEEGALIAWLTAISETAEELGQPQPPMLSLYVVQALGQPHMLVEIEGIAALD